MGPEKGRDILRLEVATTGPCYSSPKIQLRIVVHRSAKAVPIASRRRSHHNLAALERTCPWLVPSIFCRCCCYYCCRRMGLTLSGLSQRPFPRSCKGEARFGCSKRDYIGYSVREKDIRLDCISIGGGTRCAALISS